MVSSIAMKYEPEQAWKWRLRAEEMRTRADMTKDPDARNTYFMLARAWDDKAALAEKEPWRGHDAADPATPPK